MLSVSVIVPAFKRIDQTIQTLKLLKSSTGINQEFKLELIVSDSSPDNLLEKRLDSVFGNQVIYSKPKSPGIAANKNQGARIASNPILIFCDSDMEVEQETLKNTIVALKKSASGAAFGGRVVWKGGPLARTLDRPRVEDRLHTLGETTYTEAIYSRFMATYSEIFWKVGGFDEEVFNMRGEGSDLSIRFWRAGYPLVYDSSIMVHHVYDVPDAAAIRVTNSEWGIAKDLVLLVYKYNMGEGDYPNFTKTVAASFLPLKEAGYADIIQGLAHYLEFITKSKPIIDRQKGELITRFDFKFLEIFSRPDLLIKCIKASERELKQIRENIFYV